VAGRWQVGQGAIARPYREHPTTSQTLFEDQLTKAVPLHVPMAAVEGATLYLATVGVRPAAAAALFVEHGIGHLANASTLPHFRGRGCQTALIERRLRDAAAAGCSRASVVAAWGSQSHRNLVKAGFRTAYTKAVWRFGE
jgi:GNAT superfamily N-acetyltransferase